MKLTRVVAAVAIIFGIAWAWTARSNHRLDAALTVATDSLGEALERLQTAEARRHVAEVALAVVDSQAAADSADAVRAIAISARRAEAARERAASTAAELGDRLASDSASSALFGEHLAADGEKDSQHEAELEATRRLLVGTRSQLSALRLAYDERGRVIDAWAESYAKLETVNAINVERAKGGIRLPLGIRVPAWVGYAAVAGAGVAIGRGM